MKSWFTQAFRLGGKLPKTFRILLATIPFIFLVIIYSWGSAARHRENPDDKIMPSFSQMADGIKRVAFEKDRDDDVRLWVDTKISLQRFFSGVLAGAVAGILLGLFMGVFPLVESMLFPFISAFAKIPPLAILPILFIMFGIEEPTKIMLIFLGISPVIALTVYLAVKEVPGQLITKSYTLGASTIEIVFKIIFRLVLPKALDAVRLTLGAAWVYLIAAESIAADSGLGYRIFVVRRYMAMDIIIPYVIWIGFLGFLMDMMLTYIISWKYPWVNK